MRIVPSPKFDREIKRLAKKYRSIPQDFRILLQLLQANPTMGEPLGKDCFKSVWLFLLKTKEKAVAQES